MAAFPVLSEAAYVDYLGHLQHRGANATTHLALIRYPVQAAPMASVVKYMPADGLKACNEALAWLFLRAAGVRTPPYAALIVLSEAKARRVLGRRTRLPDCLISSGMVLAWAAQQQPALSIRALFKGAAADDRWLKALCTFEGAALAAFDEAFLNMDRNTGNVLYASPEQFLAIDHEQLFGLHDWVQSAPRSTTISSDSLRTLRAGAAQRRISTQQHDTALSRMVAAAQRHGAALQACQAQMTALLLQLYPDRGAAVAAGVLSFAAERTLEHWMSERLGVVG